MNQIITRPLKNYELIDSGAGYKLERFGSYVLSRPDPNAIWNKHLSETEWQKADALFKSGPSEKSQRWANKNVIEPWKFIFDPITLLLRLTPFKHTGVFPEQTENWSWFAEKIYSRKNPKILNLFGYTGGATLFSASCGAQVTHVDASRPTMIWAHENQEISKLTKAPIRWITDDALIFAQREVRRGNKYDAVILDPPSFGRSPKGKIFKFENDMPILLDVIKKLLSNNPLFVLMNSYATGYSPQTIDNLASDHIKGEHTYGELCIQESKSNRILPCSQFVRITF